MGNDGLVGDTSPVLSLCRELSAAKVRLQCFPGKSSPHTGNGLEFATGDWYPTEATWRIYFPSGCHAHQVYHELLHVQLRSIRKSGIMVAQAGTDLDLQRNVEELNNDFDHAHVVPLEIAVYPEAAEYWARDFERRFREVHESCSDPLGLAQRRLDLLRGWLVLPIAIPKAKVTQSYRAALQNHGWLSEADEMTNKVQAAGANRAAAVQAFRESLAVDFLPACAIRFATLQGAAQTR